MVRAERTPQGIRAYLVDFALSEWTEAPRVARAGFGGTHAYTFTKKRKHHTLIIRKENTLNKL